MGGVGGVGGCAPGRLKAENEETCVQELVEEILSSLPLPLQERV